MTSRESSDEKDRQRQAARESHKKVSLVIARRRALKDMTMDLEKRGSRVLPALATALARPSASSSHRGTCRPRRRNRLRLPKPRCGGDCQHPCPSPSRLSGLFGVPGALDGEAYPNEKLLIAGLAVTAIQGCVFLPRDRTKLQKPGCPIYLSLKKTSALPLGLSIYLSKKRAPHFFCFPPPCICWFPEGRKVACWAWFYPS